MVRLYSGSGSGEVDPDDALFKPTEWARRKAIAVRLLRVRNGDASSAAHLLEATPFDLLNAHNTFQDEVCILRWTAPLEAYEKATKWSQDANKRSAFAQIADTVSEVLGNDGYIRFVVVDLDMSPGLAAVVSPNLAITSDVVEQAPTLADLGLASRALTVDSWPTTSCTAQQRVAKR